MNEAQNIVMIQLLDIIHCNLYHQLNPYKLDSNMMRYYRTLNGSNGKCNKFMTKVFVKKSEANNDYICMDQLMFGYLFFYWRWFEQSVGYIANPRYDTFKYEMLNNKIYSVSDSQWNTCLYKAAIYQKCINGKKLNALNIGENNNDYMIPKDWKISITHIMSILFYINFPKLQYNFKKYGLRKVKTTDTFQDIKHRNKEIGNFYKIFYESIIFFGHETNTERENEIFYHSLSTKVLCTNFNVEFQMPISTTIIYQLHKIL